MSFLLFFKSTTTVWTSLNLPENPRGGRRHLVRAKFQRCHALVHAMWARQCQSQHSQPLGEDLCEDPHAGTCWRCTCVISGYKRKSSLNGHLIIEASSGKPDARQKELIDLPWSSQLKGWSLYFADPNSTILISHARLPSVGSQHAWLHFGQQFPGNRVFPEPCSPIDLWRPLKPLRFVGHFWTLKWRYSTTCLAIFWGDSLKVSITGAMYGRYLQFFWCVEVRVSSINPHFA